MHVLYIQAALSAFVISSVADTAPRRRCAFGDDCWPDEESWKSFNASISGHLIRSCPSAAVCHEKQHDAGLCTAAKQGWESSFWRTNQSGAYSALLWELGDDQCFINSPLSAPCDQGLGEPIVSLSMLLVDDFVFSNIEYTTVPHFSVDVHAVEDVQAAVKFASERDLYLVV